MFWNIPKMRVEKWLKIVEKCAILYKEFEK